MKYRNNSFLFSIFTLAAAFAFNACSPAAPKLKPEATATYEKNDINTDSVEARPVVDILFVIDDSGSMYTHQQNLANNIDDFLNSFVNQKNINFHIGVITTDMDDPSRSGKLAGYPKIIDQNTPNLLNSLRTSIMQGTNGSVDEMTFDPINAALNTSLATTYNAGFLRKDAYLAIIYLGDEDDQSAMDGNTLLNNLIALKGNKNKILSYGVLDSFPGPNNYCYGGAFYQPRLVSFFQSTVNAASGKNLMSLCDPQFGLKLIDFSKDLVRYINAEIKLNKAPIVSSIRVFFGTQELPSDVKKGWYYDPKINAVILGDEVVLDPNQPDGTGVRVSFNSIPFSQ